MYVVNILSNFHLEWLQKSLKPAFCPACIFRWALEIQVSAATDKPARRSAPSPPCYTVRVMNWWPRPYSVYHTDSPTKLTASETISCSRDMVGAYQNLNGSRDLTTPLSGMVSHLWASTCYRQPTYQIWSLNLQSSFTTKIWKAIQNIEMGWFVLVRVTENSANR